MIELFRLAAEVQDFCQRQQWPFCFIGGIAVQRWREPRVTLDWAYIERSLSPLAELKESPEILGRLHRLRSARP